MTKLELPRAVLFDLDGTLLDNSTLVIEAYYTGMIKLGYQPKEREFIRGLLGKTTFAIGRELNLLDEDLPKIDAHFWDYFGTYALNDDYKPDVYSGVIEVLTFFYNNSVPIGICTSNKATFARSLMKKVNLDHYISIYIGKEDVSEMKPAPEPLLLGMKRLGFEKLSEKDETLWYVGDSTPDIEAAHNAGFLSFGVPEKDKYEQIKSKNPDYLFESMNELYKYLVTNAKM